MTVSSHIAYSKLSEPGTLLVLMMMMIIKIIAKTC